MSGASPASSSGWQHPTSSEGQPSSSSSPASEHALQPPEPSSGSYFDFLHVLGMFGKAKGTEPGSPADISVSASPQTTSPPAKARAAAMAALDLDPQARPPAFAASEAQVQPLHDQPSLQSQGPAQQQQQPQTQPQLQPPAHQQTQQQADQQQQQQQQQQILRPEQHAVQAQHPQAHRGQAGASSPGEEDAQAEARDTLSDLQQAAAPLSAAGRQAEASVRPSLDFSVGEESEAGSGPHLRISLDHPDLPHRPFDINTGCATQHSSHPAPMALQHRCSAAAAGSNQLYAMQAA